MTDLLTNIFIFFIMAPIASSFISELSKWITIPIGIVCYIANYIIGTENTMILGFALLGISCLCKFAFTEDKESENADCEIEPGPY